VGGNLEAPVDGKAVLRCRILRHGCAGAGHSLGGVPLNLIHGPPNSGRAGLIRRDFEAALDHDPVLVVPNADDVFGFERELSEGGAALGGAVMTFGALFRAVATAGGAPPRAELSAEQRLWLVSSAIAERRGRLGPLRRSAERPGFALAFERLLGELQAAGLEPGEVDAGAGTLEGSAYLNDLTGLCAGYAQARERSGRVDSHQIAREAIALLGHGSGFWQRPLFLYGLDDLTPNQFELIAALEKASAVTVALPFEEGNSALAARAGMLEQLREGIGADEETLTAAEAANTDSPLLFHLERSFGAPEPAAKVPDRSLVLLRSAGTRGEAESIAAEVTKLIHGGVGPEQVAIALRDPVRRGPLIAAVLESYGLATALEAELPVAATAVGGGLIALLEAEFGSGRASDVLRFLRGPSGVSPRRVDWLERAVRRGRVQTATEALELWGRRDANVQMSDVSGPSAGGDEVPRDLARIREAAGRSPAVLLEEVGRLAATMASRPLRGRGDGPRPEVGDGIELRAAAAISAALADLAALGQPAPRPQDLAGIVAGLSFQAWSGPVKGRVRIASPYRLRAGRFDHLVVGSLQDGEFPRRDRGGDPFLSEAQRTSLGLDLRRDTEAEERYLFYVCVGLARKRLYLSYRDCDESGAAEAPSPLLDDIRRLLDPPPETDGTDPVEESILRGRDLAQVVHPAAEAPSENELARSIAAAGATADPSPLLAAAGVDPGVAGRVSARVAGARSAEAASRAPGPLTNPAALESLASVFAYGGTTLEEFDLCSYRWFAGHELSPQPLDPLPEPLVQGGLMHAALDRLYGERPGGDPLPRPGTLAIWIGRGRDLVAEIAADGGLGAQPAERAMARRVERLLIRFLTEEAERESGGFEPWLLEATFGEQEGSDRPALEIDGWRLHGAIDRVDRDAAGRALVLDYKLSGSVTPREKFEERAKLQLQLYLIAVAEHWGAETVGGLYHPLRGTSGRRPRGAVLDEAAPELASYRLYRNDVVDREGFEELLTDARRRAGTIVARMRNGEIRRDPGPRAGLRGHDTCPAFCEFAPICRRDRAPASEEDFEVEDR
jgi:RecB family exonuclease